MLIPTFFCAINFNIFYNWRAEKNAGKARARSNCNEKFSARTEKFSARNEKFFYLKEKIAVVLGKKRGENPLAWALSSSLYKDTSFFREKQIALTFRNTP